MAAIGFSVSFELRRPVASSKNRRRIFRRGRRFVSLPSEDAEIDTRMIRDAALQAADGFAFGPDDALAIDFHHDLTTDRVRVTVTKVGDLPKKGKRGTRRDAHGMLETIADALQGALYPNDSAVDCGSWRRIRA